MAENLSPKRRILPASFSTSSHSRPILPDITFTKPSRSDAINECGNLILEKLRCDPAEALKIADSKLRVFPFKNVKLCWRRLFEDASLALAAARMEKWLGQRETLSESTTGGSQDHGALSEVVRLLDMAIIMTGAPLRSETIEAWFSHIETHLPSAHPTTETGHPMSPSRKKRRLDSLSTTSLDYEFPTSPSTFRAPRITYPIARESSSLKCEVDLTRPNPSPIILTDAISHWPALSHPKRRWARPSYLLGRTLGGRRLVPVELGRSYTDEGWGQQIMPFGQFLDKYILRNGEIEGESGIAYLAQHDLLAQVPRFRADVAVPDAVWAALDPDMEPDEECQKTPQNKTGDQSTPVRQCGKPKMSEPLLNMWFGPAGTISPLHTDPYDNVLCQVVGKKYVRLYAPEETPRMFPRGKEGGIGGDGEAEGREVDMSNTSAVPVEVVEMGAAAVAGEDLIEEECDEETHETGSKWDEFEKAQYVEAVLAEGEALFIPRGWWHYVRSLTVSSSVSFWWD